MLFRLNVAKNKSLITGLMYTTQNAPALLMLPHTLVTHCTSDNVTLIKTLWKKKIRAKEADEK